MIALTARIWKMVLASLQQGERKNRSRVLQSDKTTGKRSIICFRCDNRIIVIGVLIV